MASCSGPSRQAMFLVNHVFLPPKLPQEDDSSGQLQEHLAQQTLEALKAFRPAYDGGTSGKQVSAIDAAIGALSNLLRVHDFSSAQSDATINAVKLQEAFTELSEKDSAHPILLHVSAQNAGIIAYRNEDSIIVEMFELSAPNQVVIGTPGRVLRKFPGIAITVPTGKLDPSVIRTLARTLDRMSSQVVPDSTPTTMKAGQSHGEIRDPAHPKIVTELLAAFMLSLGGAADVTSIRKHTRDEVLWYKCKLPWRRSPMWLLIRVSIHLVFLRSGLEPQDALGLYKEFLIRFAVHIMVNTTPLLKDDKACTEWCDLVYIMRAKVSRRLLKLEKPLPKSIHRAVHDAMGDDVLQQTWDIIRGSEAEKRRIDMAPLQSLTFEKDTFANISRLDEFIKGLSKRQGGTTRGQFKPSCPLPTSGILSGRGQLCTAENGALKSAYYDAELSDLSGWIDSALRKQQADAVTPYTLLWHAMKWLENMVRTNFSDNPEAWSLMVIGVLELWVACDRLATQKCPLLREYSPDIDVRRFDALLLPFRSQMERLRAIEKYVSERQGKDANQGIWTSAGRVDSFSVKYFDQSPKHQALRSGIEAKAQRERDDKVKEFNSLKARYASLMNQYDTMTCSEASEMRNGQTYNYHNPPSCGRCVSKKKAKVIEIKIHEWPLPKNEEALKTVVFELETPPWFAVWRQATSFVRFKLLMCSYLDEKTIGPNSNFPLKANMHLSQHFKSNMPSSTDTPRIGLISTAKSHAKTHYKAKRISGVDKVEDLLYPNASGFRYFDFEKTCFPGLLSPTKGLQQLTRAMTYRLPSKSTAVQKFIHRQPDVGHGLPPNAVLADQSMCPGHQSLTEYKALCTIPLGLHIQWQNILLQVASSSVDFKKVETSMAVLQCMYQAGTQASTTWYRAGHLVPATMVEFGEKMLASLHDATARIEDNWSCIDELGCYIAIARRILSLGGPDVLKRDVLAFLSRTRAIGLSWVNALKERVTDATDGEKGLFRSRVARAALVCSDTFNFQDALSTGEDILGLAIAAPADAADFIECCITVQECYSPTVDSLEPILHWRWQQLCVRAYPILRDAIVKASSNALDMAVQRSWAAFNPTGAGWSSPTNLDQKSWLVAQSASRGGGKRLDVHYCLVTGELRVNGLPLSRLPKKYEDHPLYATLFGSAVVEVMPGDVPSMVFSAKKRHAGHEVNFGLSVDGKDLLVRAVKDGRTWELVDPKVLLGFPQRFVSSYVHWYDISTKTVEFRARETPWKSLAGNWRLGVGKDGMWRLAKGEDHILVAPQLLDKKTHTAGIMKDIFSPLVKESDMELLYRPSLSQLEIDLPALKLAFYLAEGSSTIQSRQFRGMSIDSDQDIGTLFGLDNKLVLKGGSDDTHRKVILIEGPLTCGRTHSHVRVSGVLEKGVACHVYDVDTRLGRLIDNGSLESKVRVCYLHALTSFCLPDPLTKRTGTEQALDILSSAAVKSFTALDEQSISLLKRIAGLAPGRTYYPDHLKVMQSVTWAHLGFIAQHSGLYRAVASLFESVAGRAFLYRDQDIEVPKLDKTSLELMTRDEIRSATFRVSQYGAEAHTTSHDREYSSRDTRQDSEKARDAFYLADYIVNQRKELPCAMPPNTGNRFWRYLFEASGKQVLGSQSRLRDHGEEMPMYDGRWLLDTHQMILAKNLILYHDALSGRTQAIAKFDVAIWLSTLAFAKKADMTFIQLIASMVNERSMDLVLPPEAKGFYAGRGYTFHKEPILGVIMSKSAYRQFHACPEYQASKGKGYEEEERSRTRYTDNRTKALAAFVDCVKDQWPCSQPRLADHERMGEWGTYVESKKAIRIVYERTMAWYDNYELERYLSRIVDLLPESKRPSVNALREVKNSAVKTLPRVGHRPGFISKDDLFLCPPLVLGQLASKPDLILTHSTMLRPHPESSLNDLLSRLDSLAHVAFEKDYVASHHRSINSLAARRQRIVTLEDGARELVETYVATCRDRMEDIYSAINDALGGHISSLFTAKRPFEGNGASFPDGCFSAHCPRLSPSFLLRQISQEPLIALPHGWKKCIVEYGVAIVGLQRAERMASAARRGDIAALSNELLNAGHSNWNPLDYPDSLLLEVESGLTIRGVQEEIASRMRAPPGDTNAVMQLNMGEGKSTVIVPIVASALADGTRLVRVFVGKPQSKQMLEMLISKLGGLLNRVVFQLPFSRSLQVDNKEALSIRHMLETCMKVGGVLLVQPEHVLSLQQMGTEYAISPEKAEAAASLNRIRHFLYKNARDIVDESDENFNVKFELVYTMGLQQPVDHSPQRWGTVQEVLGLLREIAPELQNRFPDAIELQGISSPGSFPRTRVMTDEAMQGIIDKLVSRVCESSISGLPVSRQTPAVRNAVSTYLGRKGLSEGEINCVEQPGPDGFWSETVRQTLVHLRGLLACNVLGFTLMQKRWRVKYGLAPDRRPQTRLAVPFRAKDQPSARSEFSHPDVVILLTLFAYYYEGLTDDDMFLALDHLLASDQAEIEYGRWVRGNADMPGKFETLAGVNTEDRDQCVTEVFPHLKHSMAVIDYFLDHIVFPKEMKEFPSKLSSSGWDLGEPKVHPTTGFSGTNDSRRLLPLGMKQLDLEKQQHTNGLVLSYLLQPETSVTNIPPRSPKHTSDADALIDLVIGLDPPVRVILDVGAQVLELGNFEVASQWLERTKDEHTQAVVFFNDDDELSVVDRTGYTERLQTSTFASQMDACLVFLDEAHTRGTDLKLPTNYRAAVTLGADQTKDELMQGCMRMRKLGHGQSVVFCVPREIRTKINALLSHAEDREIQVSDILIWSIKETWTMQKRGVQLWALQGRRHEKSHRLWTEFTNNEGVLSPSQAEQFPEDEAQTIFQRYRPRARKQEEDAALGADAFDPITERLLDFGALECDAAALYEEQERELAPEIEAEREQQRPPATTPAIHTLNADIKLFAVEGTLVPKSAAYMRAFASLSLTRPGKEFGVNKLSSALAPNLLITADFAQTVKLPTGVGVFHDLYLRPVQWVLVSRKQAGEEPLMMIVSPFEANHLMPIMAKGSQTTLHIYYPRVNPAFPSLDDLQLFSFPRKLDEPIPESLAVALNLFAGQLYFNDFAMYVAACKFLGLSWERAKDGEVLDSDGFILRGVDGRPGGESGFRKSPVKFLRDLMYIRRDLQAIGGTHVGDMLDNRPLTEDTFNQV